MLRLPFPFFDLFSVCLSLSCLPKGTPTVTNPRKLKLDCEDTSMRLSLNQYRIIKQKSFPSLITLTYFVSKENKENGVLSSCLLSVGDTTLSWSRSLSPSVDTLSRTLPIDRNLVEGRHCVHFLFSHWHRAGIGNMSKRYWFKGTELSRR